MWVSELKDLEIVHLFANGELGFRVAIPIQFVRKLHWKKGMGVYAELRGKQVILSAVK